MKTPRRYLIWDNAERGAWHRPNLHGYTCDINEAGRFDEATARRIVDNAGVAEDGAPDTIMMLKPTGRIVVPATPGTDPHLHFQAPTLDYTRAARLADVTHGPRCLLCGCTENRPCATICVWATEHELTALGLSPMTADLCTACLPSRRPTAGEVHIARTYAARLSAPWTHDPAGPDPRPAAHMHALHAVIEACDTHRRAGDLTQWMTRAASDPGSIAGRRRGPSWGEGEEGYTEQQETLTDWIRRAVQTVLSTGGCPRCERCCEVIQVDDLYDPPLPGIGLWEHKGTCPPRVATNGCGDCAAEPGQRHRNGGCPGNRRATEQELTGGA